MVRRTGIAATCAVCLIATASYGQVVEKKGLTLAGAKELGGPNGLAFSPDEKFLYVDNWDPKKKVVMRYPVSPMAASARRAVLRHDRHAR